MSSPPALRRNLSARQLQLMALGSTIGVGLFLGSATAIELAGPSILLAYAVAGLITFIVLRALGEIAAHHPVSGSFAVYATTYAHPMVGFLVGWGYWAYWTIIAVAEVTAVGIYMQFWFPGSPQWQWALGAILLMGGFNLLAARVFGELEFWFALIKIVTILALIVLGALVILWGFPGHWKPYGLGNLVDHGGFFPNGLTGCLLAMQMVLYAYVGAEMIGLTGEVGCQVVVDFLRLERLVLEDAPNGVSDRRAVDDGPVDNAVRRHGLEAERHHFEALADGLQLDSLHRTRPDVEPNDRLRFAKTKHRVRGLVSQTRYQRPAGAARPTGCIPDGR